MNVVYLFFYVICMMEDTCDIDTSVSKYKIQLGRYDSMFDSAMSEYKSALKTRENVTKPCNNPTDKQTKEANTHVTETKEALDEIVAEETTYFATATNCITELKTILSDELTSATGELVDAQYTSDLAQTVDETSASKERLEDTFAVYNFYVYAIVLLLFGMLILSWLIYANREKIGEVTENIASTLTTNAT